MLPSAAAGKLGQGIGLVGALAEAFCRRCGWLHAPVSLST